MKTIKTEQEYDKKTQAVFITENGVLIKDIKSLKVLYLRDNKITKIENIPEDLKVLYLGWNKITKIENIPEGLKELYLSENKITKIENIPEDLKVLYLRDNKITKIEKKSLEILKRNKTRVYGVEIDKLEVEK